MDSCNFSFVDLFLNPQIFETVVLMTRTDAGKS